MNTKVLSISLDTNILEQTYGNVQSRQLAYAKYFEKVVVVVLSRKPFHTDQTPSVYFKPPLFAYATKSNWRITMAIRGLFLSLYLAYKHQVQVVTSQGPYLTGFIAWIVSRVYSIPYVLQLHSTYFLVNYHLPQNYIQQLFQRFVYWQIKQADAIRVVNPDVYRKLKKLYPSKKIYQLPLMVDVQSFYQPVRDRPIYTNFITVGRLSPEKNQRLMLTAFAKIVKKYPKVRLTIVGDGPLREDLLKQVSSLGLDKFVTMFGAATPKQIKYLFKKHHAFVLSSNYEGLAVVLIEAAAAGLPLISTRVGAAESMFEADKSALLTKINSIEGLCRVLCKLIAYPEIGYKLAVRAQAKAITKFDGNRLKREWVELLQSTQKVKN